MCPMHGMKGAHDNGGILRGIKKGAKDIPGVAVDSRIAQVAVFRGNLS
jgi:hypothetical protein